MTANMEQRAREAALEAWRALPEDERNGERPYIMGFNAGWEAAEAAHKSAEDDLGQFLEDMLDQHAGLCVPSSVCNEIARLVLARPESALKGQPASSGWEGIETAPKVHGHPILSTNRHGALAIICWNDNAIFHDDPSKPISERFSTSGAWDDGEREDYDDFTPYDPLFWQPLPSPPEPAAPELG